MLLCTCAVTTCLLAWPKWITVILSVAWREKSNGVSCCLRVRHPFIGPARPLSLYLFLLSIDMLRRTTATAMLRRTQVAAMFSATSVAKYRYNEFEMSKAAGASCATLPSRGVPR